jgi:hypothetical protein
MGGKMNLSDLFDVFNKFFSDIVSSIIPGVVLIIGFWFIFNQPSFLNNIVSIPPVESSSWIFLTISSYMLGHIISSIGESLLLPAIEFIFQKLNHACFMTREQIIQKFRDRSDYKIAIKRMNELYKFSEDDIQDKDFKFWRNLALATTQDNNHLVYRFTSLYLLNLGVATGLLIVSFLWVIFAITEKMHCFLISFLPINIPLVALLIFSSFCFIERYYQFFRRSIQTPFGMALVKLAEKELKNK